MNCQPLSRFQRPVKLASAIAVLGALGLAATACGGSASAESRGGGGASSGTDPQPRSKTPTPSTPGTPGTPSGSDGSSNKGTPGNGNPPVDCSKVKCIALTFDDGPGPYTAQLLDSLKQENVPATFFVVGQRAVENPALVKREAAEGHEVGNHTWDHKDLSKLDAAGIQQEINKSADAIAAAGAPRPTLLRPPYGAVNDQVRSLAGGPLIMWRVDPEDWKYRDSAKVAEAIVSKAKAGRIILSHDIRQTTVQAIPEVVRQLRGQGYTFVTVSALMNGANMQNGKSYFNRPPSMDPTPDSTQGSDTVPDPNSTPGTSGEAPPTSGA